MEDDDAADGAKQSSSWLQRRRSLPIAAPSKRNDGLKSHAGSINHRRAMSRQNVSAKSSAAAISPDVHNALTALDDKLVEVLRNGGIRLVNTKWLLAQPADYRMPRRQELERLERSGVSPSPLLSPVQAVALIRRGDRSVGVLSQCVCRTRSLVSRVPSTP